MGVTGLVDFEFSGAYGEWAERFAEGARTVRVRSATYADGLDAVVVAGLRTGDVLPGCDERITMGPLKIISDGSLNTRTAWCCEPYADGSGTGAANQTTDELHDLLRRAHDAGLEVATHAIGDAAVREVLDAYAATGATGSVEHAQLVLRDDVTRMARLGIRASVQPAHLLDDRDATERVWPGRADRSFALRWMLDDGVELALGSDAPVSPLDPWLAIAAAVHRTADDRDAWHPEQALTPREALAASVDGAGHGPPRLARPTWRCSTTIRCPPATRPSRPRGCERRPSPRPGSPATWSTTHADTRPREAVAGPGAGCLVPC